MTSNVIARAGYQSLDRNNVFYNNSKKTNAIKQSIDPDVFKLYMQQPNSGVAFSIFGDQKPQYIDVNTKKINSKEEYASVLRKQIEEKESFKRLQNSPERNYNKVTNYNPADLQQQNIKASQIYNPYSHNRLITYQKDQIQKSEIQQPTAQAFQIFLPPQASQTFLPPQSFIAPLTYQPKQQSPQREQQVQNESQVQPKNTRGLFLKELYQTQQQQALKDQASDQYKNELLKQMEEKRLKKQAEKEREEQEDLRYMEKFNRQVVELQDQDQTNERKISKLHAPLNTNKSYPSVILPPALIQQDDPSQFEDLKDRLDQITRKQNSYINDAQLSQVQNRVDFDMMKEYYQYQQILFDRDLVKLREELTRADQTRMNAERELLFLQDRAREKRIWDVFNYENSDSLMGSYLPQERSIFRTAKYAIGHQSESEKRQNILRDYYKGERQALALGPLGVAPQDDNQDRELVELPTESGQIQPQRVKQNETHSIRFGLDPQLEVQIQKIKKRVNLPDFSLPSEQINKDDFERQFQEHSQVEVLKNLDIKAITVHEKKFISESIIKPSQKSDGFKTEVDEILKKEIEDRIKQQDQQDDVEYEEELQQSEQSSHYDFPIDHQKTEQIFHQQEVQQENTNLQLQIDWQQDIEDEEKDELDILDKQIGYTLDQIKDLVTHKGTKQDYYSIQTEMKFKEMKNSNNIKVKEKNLIIKDWKDITLLKNKQNIVQNILQPQPQNEQLTNQNLIIDERDPLDRLDDLLKNYNK